MRLCTAAIEFEPTAHATWRAFHREFFARISQLDHLIHPYYRQHLDVLARFADGVPTLNALAAVLAPIGWRPAYVDGYTAPWKISRMLAQRIFPVSRRVRPQQELMFASEPDLLHDIFGHLPILLSPEYRLLLQRWAQVAAHEPITELDRTQFHLNKVIIEAQDHVRPEDFANLKTASQALTDFFRVIPTRSLLQDRIYFWIFEFGMIEQAGQRQVLGAGILSSLTELSKIATQPIVTRALTADSFLAGYNISSEQNDYLVVSNESDYYAFLDRVSPVVQTGFAQSQVRLAN